MIEAIKQRRDLSLQENELALHDAPHHLGVHTEVVVHQNVPHADDLRPGNVRSVLAGRFRNRSGCFADDLQVADVQLRISSSAAKVDRPREA